MTRFQKACESLKRKNMTGEEPERLSAHSRFKRWLKESLQPISTSIEDMQEEAKRKKEDWANRPVQDPEEALFASMSKRRDDEIAREQRRYKTQAIRKLANQLLVIKSKEIDLRTSRLNSRDGSEALEMAYRIYELTENYTLPEHPPQ